MKTIKYRKMFVYVDSINDRNQNHMWKCILRPRNKTWWKLPLLWLRWKCACSWWEANKIEITRKWWKYYHKIYIWIYLYIDMRRIICLLPFTFVRINKAFIFSLFWNLFDLNVRSSCAHMWMVRQWGDAIWPPYQEILTEITKKNQLCTNIDQFNECFHMWFYFQYVFVWVCVSFYHLFFILVEFCTPIYLIS